MTNKGDIDMDQEELAYGTGLKLLSDLNKDRGGAVKDMNQIGIKWVW